MYCIVDWQESRCLRLIVRELLLYSIFRSERGKHLPGVFSRLDLEKPRPELDIKYIRVFWDSDWDVNVCGLTALGQLATVIHRAVHSRKQVIGARCCSLAKPQAPFISLAD